jgi:hypothetical protein
MSDNTSIGDSANDKRALVKWYDPHNTICAGFTQGLIRKVSFNELLEKGMLKVLAAHFLSIVEVYTHVLKASEHRMTLLTEKNSRAHGTSKALELHCQDEEAA